MRGWHGESQRHSLAARGIRTNGVQYPPGYKDVDYLSSDGSVEGELMITPDAIHIYAWMSAIPGAGNTVRSIQELKERYSGRKVVVHGIGEDEESNAWQYWMHMLKTGRVDLLVDDFGGEYVR